MKKAIFIFVFMFSVLFTFTTLLSAGIQLIQGVEMHSNPHIMMRSGFVFVGSIVSVIFLFMEFRFRFIKYLIAYIVAIMMIMGIIYLSGIFVELHPDAYRDGFWNFTIIGIGVMSILYIGEGFYLKRMIPEQASE